MGEKSHFEASFSALVKCLDQSFRKGGTVSLPNNITKPFRQAFNPTESSLLRSLQKVLENGRPKNILRLDSQSFYIVTSISLHFPYSETQNKLLYLFMVGDSPRSLKSDSLGQETIRQYKNENTFAPVLSRIHGTEVTPAEVKEQGDYIGRKLSPCILRHLLAQFLSVLLRISSVAKNQIMDTTECQYLTTILETEQSYFLRILVADVVRELLFNGAEREPLKKSCIKSSIVDDFPLSKNGDSMWMSKVLDHLSGVDLTRAFVGQSEQIFKVQRLECDGNEYFESPSPFVATVSSEISFLFPSGADMLTLFSVPISKNISLSRPASEPESSTILEIQYPGVEGDRFINGSKGAINSLAMTFCDKEALEAFIQMIEERQVVKVPDDVPSAPGTPKRHSIAFIELESASVDDNHENGKRLNTKTTSEVDASSPLHDISLRTRQKQGSTIASTTQIRDSKPALSSGVKPAEDMHALKSPSEEKPLIERLRASQKDPKGVQLKGKVSSRQSHLGHGDSKVDLAEGASGEEESSIRWPAAAIGLTLQPQNHDFDQFSSSSGSKNSQPAKLANKSTSTSKKAIQLIGADTRQDGDKRPVESARKQPKDRISMAKLVEAQPGSPRDSQAGNGPAKAGLKRRVIQDSTALRNEQSQKLSKSPPKAAEFDFPPNNDEEYRPAKKAKTKNPKAPAKAVVKESVVRKGEDVQVSASPKGQKQRGTDKKLAKMPEGRNKKSQKTAASTRARRAAKTPKYVEDSDESRDDSIREEAGEEEEIEAQQMRDTAGEGAEDSRPLSKGALGNALKTSQLSFESNMREIVARDSTDAETRPTKTPPVRDRRDEQAAPKHSLLGQLTRHERTPAMMKKHVSNPPAAKVVSKDNPDIKNHANQEVTPRRNLKRLTEGSIPSVSEKLLRKTKIVHFGPHGPDNQAIQQKSLVELIEPETTKETSPIPRQLGLVQGEHVEDIDELFPDHSSESISKSPEIKKIQPPFTLDDDDILEEPIEERDTNVNTYAEDPKEQSVERHNVSTTVTACDRETSEHVASEIEEAASDQSFRVPDTRSSHKTDIQQFRPQPPLLDDEVSTCDATEAEGPPVARKLTRQTIGINSILEEEYPQAQKVFNADKLRTNHLALAMKEANRSSVASDVLRPVSKVVVKSDLIRPTHEIDEVEVICKDSVVSNVHPVSFLQAVRGDANNINERTMPSTKGNLPIVPQNEQEPSVSLPDRAAEPMGPPPPATVPLWSVQRCNPLRKSWPESQVGSRPGLSKHPVNEPCKSVTSGSVRVKKGLSLPLAGIEPMLEAELPPATPASFSTRLNLHLPLPANVTLDKEDLKVSKSGNTSQNLGNSCLTAVNEDGAIFEVCSGEGTRIVRRQRSEFRDDSSGIASPFHKTGEAVGEGNPMMGVIHARESQQGILDAIIDITNEVLFRFGTEEDAMKAKVDQYHRGGKEIIQTLTDTWNQRLEHEHRILMDVLKAEKEVLTTALQLVGNGCHSGGAWKEAVYDQELTAKVQEKRESLVRKIERLTTRG